MEDYIKDKNFIEFSDNDKKNQLMQNILQAQRDLNQAHINFEYAEDDMIDYYTYQIKAHQSKLDYLIKIAKRKVIELSRIDALRVTLYRKKNMAG